MFYIFDFFFSVQRKARHLVPEGPSLLPPREGLTSIAERTEKSVADGGVTIPVLTGRVNCAE